MLKDLKMNMNKYHIEDHGTKRNRINPETWIK